MRRAIIVVSLLAAGAARAAGTPPPSCPIGSAWTQTWTNGAGNLTYKLTSPCYVTFDTDFIITAQVIDTLCVPPSYTDQVQVGTGYQISDTRLDGSNATSVIGGAGSPGFGGVGMITVFDGQWVTTVKQHYGPGGTPTNHKIAFSFTPRIDTGCTLPSHFWSATIVGTTTYDPYATSSSDPGLVGTDTGTGSSSDPGLVGTDTGSSSSSTGSPGAAGPGASTPSGGCGSSGVAPALIGLAALAAAGWPRRRRS
jgi:hypothetical protein